MNQKSALGQVYQEVNVSMLHHQLFEFTFLKECLPSQHMDNSSHVFWCQPTTPLIMVGRRKMESCFQFGPHCLSPARYSTWTWSALAKVPALHANAWKQSWSAHVFASAHVISSWTKNNLYWHNSIQCFTTFVNMCQFILTQLFEQILFEQLYSNQHNQQLHITVTLHHCV